DNEKFADSLSYRERIRQLGIPVRELEVDGRIVVTVLGANGLPASGAVVTFTTADVAVTLRSTADGSVRFHPAAYDISGSLITVQAGDAKADVAAGDDLELLTDLPGGAVTPMAMDVMFLLDATGSMDDEIAQLKSTISEVAGRIGDLPVAPDVRFGMTLYRDLEDSFVTSTFDLTNDIVAFDEALSAVVAEGGGDYAEALDEGLAAALSEPSWRGPGEAIQLVFLVGDAPPQVGRGTQQTYTTSMLDAAARGIKIFPVSSSGTDDQAEFVFRQLAQFTGGRYVFLSYGAGGRATGETSDISEVDYEELALDDLIVRLVAEEIADLTGDETVVPPPQTTTTQTNPNG
ncbi:MAG: VWA domain-containing protein, partial [Acidimicrobiales bacterium]